MMPPLLRDIIDSATPPLITPLLRHCHYRLIGYDIRLMPRQMMDDMSVITPGDIGGDYVIAAPGELRPRYERYAMLRVKALRYVTPYCCYAVTPLPYAIEHDATSLRLPITSL